MRRNFKLYLAICGSLLFAVHGLGQDAGKPDELAGRAAQEFRDNDFPAAERDFRELVKRDPENVVAQMYLGHSLFRQERYADAAVAFQKARDLQNRGEELDKVQDRILTDQLVIWCGITGNLKKAFALLDVAIAKDPEYPMNYYLSFYAFGGVLATAAWLRAIIDGKFEVPASGEGFRVTL
jgi:predicted Zn-dependent protease